MIIYNDPLPCVRPDGTPYTGNVESRVTREDAVNFIRSMYMRDKRPIIDDEELLKDFIAIHFAREEAGLPNNNESRLPRLTAQNDTAEAFLKAKQLWKP